MPYIETGTYYADNTDRPAVGAMAPTTLLNDLTVDNTTTGPTEAVETDSDTGDACSAVMSCEAYQTVAWSGGALYDITAMRSNGRCRYPDVGLQAQCLSPPGVSVLTSESEWEYTIDPAGATGWTTLQHNDLLDGSFEIVTWNGTLTVYWIRRVMRALQETTGISTPIPGTYIAAAAQVTDWRIEGTLSPENPPTPTPTPDPGDGGGGLPGGDNGWTVTPIPTTPPWDRVCGEGESGWTRSNTG